MVVQTSRDWKPANTKVSPRVELDIKGLDLGKRRIREGIAIMQLLCRNRGSHASNIASVQAY